MNHARQAQAARCLTGLFRDFRRLLNASAVAVLLGILGLLTAHPAPAADKGELDALRGRIEKLKKDLAGAEENRSEAGDGLRESERGISEANRLLRNLGLQQQAVRADLDRIKAQSRLLEANIGAQQRQLGQLLYVRYASGQQDYARLLLAGRDPNQTARDLHYYSYISRNQAEFIRTLRKNLSGLEDLARETRGKSAELADLEAQQSASRKELLAQKAERQRVITRLATQIRSQRREISSLQRDETRLSRLVEELAKVIAPRGGGQQSARRNDRLPEAGREAGLFATLRGKLRLPARGELINRFGSPRSESGVSWKGLFIRSASGQEVRAVAGGQVVYAEWMRGFGNLLILDHGQGYLTIYGNNEALLKQVGDAVKTGDTVATVGNSGGNTDSGLYFEMRHQGKAFDPLRWVSLR